MTELKQLQKKVLVLSHDIAGKHMAGPGIRYVSIADELSKYFDVTLGLLDGEADQIRDISSSYSYKVQSYDDKDYKSLIDEADYIFAQHINPEMLSYIRAQNKRLIFDFYSPVPIEFMIYRYFSETGYGKTEQQELDNLIELYKQYVTYGDYFVCSNNYQRDLWTGFFLAAGILNKRPETFTDLDQLIGLSPMGIDDQEPTHNKNVLRNVIPGINQDDFILIWTGGLWDWFDPLTVVKAVEQLHQSNPKIKLVFMGVKHPNSKVPAMSEAKKTLDYIKSQGLESKCIFILDQWMPFDERINYLLEADAAIYMHKSSLETRYSHRSRVLDHIYAELPTIASGGDYLGDEVVGNRGLGVVVEEDNHQALTEAINRLVQDDELLKSIKSNIRSAKEEFFWENTTKDLVSYIQEHEPVNHLPTKIKQVKASGGVTFFLRRVIRKVKRRVLQG
ncbi:MAG: glycosyltransferase family 4 protein [Candidatus Saccharimonadales bacterium]